MPFWSRFAFSSCGRSHHGPSLLRRDPGRRFEPPEISQRTSSTFGDVVVFNQHITLRALFHALVHSIQIQVGCRGYAELWVRSFVKTRTHFTVPLEMHAFALSSKFLSPLAEKFSVEEHVFGAGEMKDATTGVAKHAPLFYHPSNLLKQPVARQSRLKSIQVPYGR